MRRSVLALLAAAVLATSCTADDVTTGNPPQPSASLSTTTLGSPPTTEPARATEPGAELIEVDERVPFTDQLVLDVLRPTTEGQWPIVVLVHGGGWIGGERADIADLAALIAGEGALVYNISYRTIALGGSFPGTYEDIACGVRFARETATAYGGDPARLALVGYSAGAHLSAVVALAGDEFGGTCLVEDGSGLPDAFVGVAGPYNSDQYSPLLNPFFGGTPTDAADAWAAGNPYTYADRRPDLRMHLVQGTADQTVPQQAALEFNEALTAAGHEVQLTLVVGAGHRDVVDPAASGSLVATAVLELLR